MLMIIGLITLFSGQASAVVQEQMYKGTAKLIEVVVPNELLNVPLKLTCTKNNTDFKKYPHTQKDQRIFAFISEIYYSTFDTVQCYLNQTKVAEILVLDKAYPITYLSVPTEQVSPSPETQARINRESALLGKIYAQTLPQLSFTQAFKKPLDSFVTSPYGVKRIYNNGELAGYHSGIDYRAPTGTEILAANRGKVVLAQDLFVTGNTVIIDHGQRLFTIYAHLSQIKVKVGQMVETQQILGLSGATGRVTGPHLHWGVRLHSVLVDGDTLIQASEDYFNRF